MTLGTVDGQQWNKEAASLYTPARLRSLPYRARYFNRSFTSLSAHLVQTIQSIFVLYFVFWILCALMWDFIDIKSIALVQSTKVPFNFCKQKYQHIFTF